jgi:hypothetical protein
MQIAEKPAAGAPAPPASEIPGWTPSKIEAVPATRRTGRIVSSIDALRGVTELGNGQPLSNVQVDTLAPALAAAYELPAEKVREDLHNVRLYTGGAALGPGWATTIGRDIYLYDKAGVERILSWPGRRWLAHELGHTMQWRRIPDEQAPSDLARLRRDYLNYTLALLHNPGPGPGGLVGGVGRWLKQRLRPEPGQVRQTLGKAIHDAHPLEIEAERHARAFAGLPPATG